MDVSTHSKLITRAVVLIVLLLTPTGFGIGPGDFKSRNVWLPSSAIAAAPAFEGTGKAPLDHLVQKARQEGEVVVTIQSSWNKALVQPLGDAFKKRFGLDIKVTVANMRPAQHFPVAIAETQARAPATYDSVQGDDAEIMQLIGAGGTQRIENWEALLAEINPMVRSGKVKPAQISRGPILQHAFLVYANIKQIVYNTKLISEAELPKTHAELA